MQDTHILIKGGTKLRVLGILTHLSQMYFLILISWTGSFLILGLLSGIFHFYSRFKRHLCKQTVKTLIVLHCLPMSHKKDDMLICVKSVDFRQVVRLSLQLIYSHYFYDLSTFEGMRKANFMHLLIDMVIGNRYIGL